MLALWKKIKSLDSYLIFCLFTFFAAQILYALAHAGFYTNYYSGLTQVGTDVAALGVIKEHFWQSMWYYHINPPLYIFYTFLFHFWFPPNGELGVYLLHTVLGVFTVYAFYRIYEKLGINKTLSVFLIAAFILSPTFNLSQTKGWYDFPALCLLLISVWRLMKLIDRTTFWNGFMFFFVVMLMASIRSVYHFYLYFIPLIAVTTLIFYRHWKIVLLSSLLPMVILFSFYFKNYYLFHVFTINSFSGEVLANVTMQFNLSLEERLEGIKKGFFSDLALCPQSADTIAKRPPNMGYTGHYCYKVIAEKYRQNYIKNLDHDYSNIPVLNDIPGTPAPHRNMLGNIGMDLEYQKNAIQSLIHYPKAYFKTLGETWRYYFTTYPAYYYENMGNVRHLPRGLKKDLLNFYPDDTASIKKGSRLISYVFLFFFPLLILFGSYLIFFDKKTVLKWIACYAISFIMLNGGFLLTAGYHVFYQERLVQIVLIMAVGGLMSLYLVSAMIYKLYCVIRKHCHFLSYETSSRTRIIAFYLICNIIYTSLIITGIAGNEQQRYRIYVDPLYLILFGCLVQMIRDYWQERPKIQ